MLRQIGRAFLKPFQIQVFVFFLCSFCFAQKAKLLVTHIPPFLVVEGDSARGPVYDKMMEIMEDSELEFSLRIVPHSRLFQELKTVPNTVTILSYSQERDSLFHWVDRVLPNIEAWLWKEKEAKLPEIKSFHELTPFRLGVIRNDLFQQKLLAQGNFKEGENLFPGITLEENIRKLLSNRIDFSIFEPRMLASELQRMGLPKESLSKVFLIEKISPHLVVNKKSSPQLIEKLRRAVVKN